MKTLRTLLFTLILFFLITIPTFGAETTYWTDHEIAPGLHVLKVTWTAAAGGTTAAVTLNSNLWDGTNYGEHMQNKAGYAILAIVDPGATAPTDNYEIILKDMHSVLIFGTALDALDTANTEDWEPDIAYRPFQWPLTFDQESGGGANAANCNGIFYFIWKEAQ